VTHAAGEPATKKYDDHGECFCRFEGQMTAEKSSKNQAPERGGACKAVFLAANWAALRVQFLIGLSLERDENKKRVIFQTHDRLIHTQTVCGFGV